jgi:acetyltransferase
LHKSDRGGVVVDIRDADALAEAWRRLGSLSADLEGILVQKMAVGMRELIVGGYQDPVFGPVVLAGLGGILVEVLQDVSMRLAPVDRTQALGMIQGLRCSAVLGRYRGLATADTDMAAETMVKVSLLIRHFPMVREVDINPILLKDRGGSALALDARVLLEKANDEDPLL